VVAADLPLAHGADLDRVVAAAAGGRAVVIVPTRDGGTGVLYRRPATVTGTAYGPGSAAAHVRLAADAGLEAVTLDVPGLALDVDDAGGLREAAARDGAAGRWAVLLGTT
jgi:2-phospho-L-lactate/phosphoenolpyruvate guanylyltransferase